MPNQGETPLPSPQRFFETLNAYQRTAALKAAIELDVFTAVTEGATTTAALARRCQASERGMRILCDYLVVIGFLTKSQNAYGLTPESSTFLDRRSPAYLGASIKFLASPMMTEAFKDVTAVVRKGGTILAEQGTLAPGHPIWVDFARAMAPQMALSADLLAKLIGAEEGRKWKVLDLAAGHGLYGITVARQNPHAEIVAVDWPNVLAVAEEHARAAGVAERYRTIPGSAFEMDYGTGYDVALVTGFLHHFDVATCEMLLKNVYAALRKDGQAVTLEFVPNEDRVSPPVPAQFAMIMLGSTPQGDAYTFRELEQMFRRAGFTSSELHELPPTYYRVVISRK